MRDYCKNKIVYEGNILFERNNPRKHDSRSLRTRQTCRVRCGDIPYLPKIERFAMSWRVARLAASVGGGWIEEN
jgi:hypothetical protein